jgi:hypothetical protein
VGIGLLWFARPDDTPDESLRRLPLGYRHRAEADVGLTAEQIAPWRLYWKSTM